MKRGMTMAAAVSAGLLVSLTGCAADQPAPAQSSSSSAEQMTAAASPSGSVSSSAADRGTSTETIFQFDEARLASSSDMPVVTAESGKLVVRMSQEMVDALPAGAHRLVDSYEITGKTFPTGICRIDVKINYLPGAVEELNQRVANRGTGKTERQQRTWTQRDVMGVTATEVVPAPPSDDDIDVSTAVMTADWQNFTTVKKCDSARQKAFELRFVSLTPEQEASELTELASVDVATFLGNDPGSLMPAVKNPKTPLKVSATGKWQAPQKWSLSR